MGLFKKPVRCVTARSRHLSVHCCANSRPQRACTLTFSAASSFVLQACPAIDFQANGMNCPIPQPLPSLPTTLITERLCGHYVIVPSGQHPSHCVVTDELLSCRPSAGRLRVCAVCADTENCCFITAVCSCPWLLAMSPLHCCSTVLMRRTKPAEMDDFDGHRTPTRVLTVTARRRSRAWSVRACALVSTHTSHVDH
jgi:hypothetical protein